jgi:acetyl esterase
LPPVPLDPQVRIILDQMIASGLKPFNEVSVEEARAAMLALAGANGEIEPIARLEDRTLPGPRGDIPVRIYTPDGKPPFPILVYFHGGGWVVGGIATHDNLCRQLANGAGAVVVSVDYRLAPEHPFPAAPEDCYAAARWIAQNAHTLGGDPGRIAVGGDSAGGNLAAVVSLMARDRGGPPLVHQLLIYPVVDAPCDNVSYRDNAKDYLLTAEMMDWFWNHYVGTGTADRHLLACPLRAASLRGLPPALVFTAEFDPLRDEGEAYAARLREEGVPVRLERYDGMIHGFFGMTALLEQARHAVDDAAATLKRAFAEAR